MMLLRPLKGLSNNVLPFLSKYETSKSGFDNLITQFPSKQFPSKLKVNLDKFKYPSRVRVCLDVLQMLKMSSGMGGAEDSEEVDNKSEEGLAEAGYSEETGSPSPPD
ncbi:uncharacterized protein A4U43_C08F18500 [Asparagus officinalis]|nr:uncharacterized protein A4U43_C08F18500 [Asparagus officinalis]